MGSRCAGRHCAEHADAPVIAGPLLTSVEDAADERERGYERRAEAAGGDPPGPAWEPPEWPADAPR